jgi:hypothetical protein
VRKLHVLKDPNMALNNNAVKHWQSKTNWSWIQFERLISSDMDLWGFLTGGDILADWLDWLTD